MKMSIVCAAVFKTAHFWANKLSKFKQDFVRVVMAQQDSPLVIFWLGEIFDSKYFESNCASAASHSPG